MIRKYGPEQLYRIQVKIKDDQILSFKYHENLLKKNKSELERNVKLVFVAKLFWIIVNLNKFEHIDVD